MEVSSRMPFLSKFFLFTQSTGLIAGAIFPWLVQPVIGPVALTAPFIAISLGMGLAFGATQFIFVRFTLRKQVDHQLELLRPLTGAASTSGSIEELQEAVAHAAATMEHLLNGLLTSTESIFRRNHVLAEGCRYLSDRAKEGLSAAQRTHADIDAMEEKQQTVWSQIDALSARSQEEAALSRELSASLEEVAGALDVSAAKFVETTTCTNEIASSVREMNSQAEEVSRSIEGTSRDLDVIGESLDIIRSGSLNGAQAAEAVKTDAEAGLKIVRAAMAEMARIEEESRKTREAMERLAVQTGDVVKIIEVIRELVSDSELLAFNAAIIAAQAGDDGRGFAVVADEIRELADRTTGSAQDIHSIVQAIGKDSREVMAAVDSTGAHIVRGRELSISAGEALGKIVASAGQSAAASADIADLTGQQGERARGLLKRAGETLKSIRVITRAIHEQQTAINRVQEGVNEMKNAADQIARGMEEQVRANREFDRGLADREEQVALIREATRFQMETSQRVFAHFSTSENRLSKNVEKTAELSREAAELERLAAELRRIAEEKKRPESSPVRPDLPKPPINAPAPPAGAIGSSSGTSR
jgi:methyl-accepting chemotaxis protein